MPLPVCAVDREVRQIHEATQWNNERSVQWSAKNKQMAWLEMNIKAYKFSRFEYIIQSSILQFSHFNTPVIHETEITGYLSTICHTNYTQISNNFCFE